MFAILVILYATNMSSTKSIYDTIVGVPVKLSFTIIEPPVGVCEDCFDANNISEMVNASHNIKYNNSSMSYNSVLSKKYIKDYDIKNLPADRKSTRLNSSHTDISRMPSSA